MDIKLLAAVFTTVFLAELGDKTQPVALLFASRPGSSLVGVFVAASLALVQRPPSPCWFWRSKRA